MPPPEPRRSEVTKTPYATSALLVMLVKPPSSTTGASAERRVSIKRDEAAEPIRPARRQQPGVAAPWKTQAFRRCWFLSGRTTRSGWWRRSSVSKEQRPADCIWRKPERIRAAGAAALLWPTFKRKMLADSTSQSNIQHSTSQSKTPTVGNAMQKRSGTLG